MPIVPSPERCRSSRRRRHGFFLFLALLLVTVWSPLAAAHGGNANLGPFFIGVTELVLHWQLVLFVVAAGCWCGQQPSAEHRLVLGSWLVGALMVGAVVAILAELMLMPALATAIGYTLVGFSVVLSLQVATGWPLAIAVLAGLVSGLGLDRTGIVGPQQATLFLLGTFVGLSALEFYVTAAAARIPAGWPQIGLRVLGSWITTVGVMVCAFAFFQPA